MCSLARIWCSTHLGTQVCIHKPSDEAEETWRPPAATGTGQAEPLAPGKLASHASGCAPPRARSGKRAPKSLPSPWTRCLKSLRRTSANSPPPLVCKRMTRTKPVLRKRPASLIQFFVLEIRRFPLHTRRLAQSKVGWRVEN